MRIQANGLALEVEEAGPPDAPAVLLVMGLGMQLIAWPPYFVEPLLRAGFRVVRFDNRDVGLSQKLDHLGVPHLLVESMRYRLGFPVRAPYTVSDMAADAFGVLDALGIREAHVVGASMGGMIAQRMALAAPERVRTLTCIMSSSGARWVPGPRPQVAAALLMRPRARTQAAVVEHMVRLFRMIGSPAFPMPEEELRAQALAALRRGYSPAGTARQLAAVAADAGRAGELARIRTPTLVIHGTDDPLAPLAAGRDLARRIPGSEFVPIRGMGHDLSPGVVEHLLPPLLSHLR